MRTTSGYVIADSCGTDTTGLDGQVLPYSMKACSIYTGLKQNRISFYFMKINPFFDDSRH